MNDEEIVIHLLLQNSAIWVCNYDAGYSYPGAYTGYYNGYNNGYYRPYWGW